MKPSLLTEVIVARYKSDMTRAMMIEGSPGIGKTQIAKQAAAKLGIECRVIHAPLMQPEDYGMPVVSAARDAIQFVVPVAKFPILGSGCAEKGILVLDELSQASNDGQKILANLIQEREIHGQKLAPGWMIIATGNRSTDRAGANRMLSHLRNRMTTYYLDLNLDDWVNWYLDQDGCRVEGIQFLRFRPDLLSNFNPQQEISATPRAWVEGVFAALDTVPKAAELETFKGDVGDGPAAEFVGFMKIYRELPDPEAVLKKPDTHKVPTEPNVKYALTGALAQKVTPDNVGAMITFMLRMPPEFMVMGMALASRKCPPATRTPAYRGWLINHGAKLLV